MKWIIVFVLNIYVLSVWAVKLPNEVKGFVLEETEKGQLRPLQFANVFWRGTTIGTVSDSTGYFEIFDDHKNHVLIVTYLGYKPDTVYVEKHAELTIILHKNIDIDAVEVIRRNKSTQVSYINPVYTQKIGQDELLKAACCNLSESFETNPSIDVSFTDAVTGTKQIKMLGLSGKYTFISRENMPDVRGVSSMYGLTYTPGPWVESIQLSKGAGTVVNGYESIAGQINVEYKKSNETDLAYLNLFANQEGRSEVNLIVSPWLGPHLSTDFYIHGNVKPWKMDANNDGFMDFPIGGQINVANRWRYNNHKGLESQLAFKILVDNKQGGQMDYDPDVHKLGNAYWGMENNTERYEAWGKLGYVFPHHKYNSIGFQWKVLDYKLDGYFGQNAFLAEENSVYVNLIFQTILFNTNHTLRAGGTLSYEDIKESFGLLEHGSIETTPGIFAEYAYNYLEKFNAIVGLRGDYSSEYNFFVTPRLHLRYAFTAKSVVRASLGIGQRNSFILSENMGLMASSRTFSFIEGDTYALVDISDLNYREKAVNYGVSFNQYFKIGYRTGNFTLDFFRTDFINQVVTDLEESSQTVYFYNLEGKSFANSFQAQVDYEIIPRLDMRLAYRWYDVQTEYLSGLKQIPLIARHRAFVNLGYETRKKWKFDATAQWQGQKRLPYTGDKSVEYQLDDYSPHIFLINSQLSKSFKSKFDVYVGVENLTDYKQTTPILSANDPFSSDFDASIIYAPIFGRMAYAGIRWNIDRKKEHNHEHGEFED